MEKHGPHVTSSSEIKPFNLQDYQRIVGSCP